MLYFHEKDPIDRIVIKSWEIIARNINTKLPWIHRRENLPCRTRRRIEPSERKEYVYYIERERGRRWCGGGGGEGEGKWMNRRGAKTTGGNFEFSSTGSAEIRTEQARDENPCQVHPFARCLPIIGSPAHVTINRGGSTRRVRIRSAFPQCWREPRLSIFALSSPARISRGMRHRFPDISSFTLYKCRSYCPI